MIFIESKRKNLDKIKAKYPLAIICDVTSTSPNSFVKLSPFFPHGGIPVPFSEGVYSFSVEGVWQGLKVFENEDISFESFTNKSMKNLKRTSRVHGRILGHRKGVDSEIILDYVTAKKQIYIPTYYWMLEHFASKLIDKLASIAKEKDIVLLDYNTSTDIESDSKPLSHAYLLKLYIENHYPIFEKPVYTTGILRD